MGNKYDSIASFPGQKRRSGNETRVLDGIIHVLQEVWFY